MKLSKQAIIDFQKIYRDDYGVVLDFEEARELATAFFIMMKEVFQPLEK
jgi:hypothetical protein